MVSAQTRCSFDACGVHYVPFPRRQADEKKSSNVYLAKLAEQAERYDEMVEYMKQISMQLDGQSDLSLEAPRLSVYHLKFLLCPHAEC